ncbi:MAG: protein kinase, partial [Planctomycetota bacterium]|nr:protein kinase [Planctomycetota bacterium]
MTVVPVPEQLEMAMSAGFLSQNQVEVAHSVLRLNPDANLMELLQAIDLPPRDIDALLDDLERRMSKPSNPLRRPPPNNPGPSNPPPRRRPTGIRRDFNPNLKRSRVIDRPPELNRPTPPPRRNTRSNLVPPRHAPSRPLPPPGPGRPSSPGIRRPTRGNLPSPMPRHAPSRPLNRPAPRHGPSRSLPRPQRPSPSGRFPLNGPPPTGRFPLNGPRHAPSRPLNPPSGPRHAPSRPLIPPAGIRRPTPNPIDENFPATPRHSPSRSLPIPPRHANSRSLPRPMPRQEALRPAPPPLQPPTAPVYDEPLDRPENQYEPAPPPPVEAAYTEPHDGYQDGYAAPNDSYEEPAPEPVAGYEDEFDAPLPGPPGQDSDEQSLDSDSFDSLPVPLIEAKEPEPEPELRYEVGAVVSENIELEEKVKDSGGSVETGQVIYGSYIIEREVGRGRSSTVYLAVHEANGQRVAVKIPHPERSGLKDRIRRLKREKEILESLSHAAVPRFVAGEMEGMSPYLMTGFAEGKTLQSFVGKRNFNAKELKSIVIPICEALIEAHRIGVLHLGLNGQCVFLQKDWTPTVIGMSHPTKEHLDSDSVLFLSPEQLSGETNKLGPHCDVWSLGVLIYVLLFGRFPVEVGSATAIAAKLMLEGINQPTEKELKRAPGQLARACVAALTPNIEERPSIEEIHQILTGREPIAVGRWALRIGVAFALIFGLYWGLTYQTTVEPKKNVANLSIGLPANYEPLWVYRKPEDLSPDVPNRWVLRRDSISVASMPEITDRMRPVDRLRALRDLFTGKIVVDEKDKRRLKVVYDTPQTLTDINRWVLQPLKPALFRAQFSASQLRFKSGVVYGAQSCWSIGEGDAMGPLNLVIGGACWEDVKVTLECAGASEDVIGVKIGSAPELVLNGPQSRAEVEDFQVKTKISLGWERYSISAGNEFGADVQIGETKVKELGAYLKKPIEAGPVSLRLERGTLKVKRIVLEGVPVTTDVPALARVMERFRLDQSLRVDTNVTFEDENVPGAALFRLVYQGGRVDVRVGAERFELIRDGRLIFSRKIEFSGGLINFAVGYGRWRFIIQGNKPIWFLDGTLPKTGDLT